MPGEVFWHPEVSCPAAKGDVLKCFVSFVVDTLSTPAKGKHSKNYLSRYVQGEKFLQSVFLGLAAVRDVVSYVETNDLSFTCFAPRYAVLLLSVFFSFPQRVCIFH